MVISLHKFYRTLTFIFFALATNEYCILKWMMLFTKNNSKNNQSSTLHFRFHKHIDTYTHEHTHSFLPLNRNACIRKNQIEKKTHQCIILRIILWATFLFPFFRCELFFMTLSDSMKSDMLGIWIEWRRGCREEFQNAQSILSHTWIFFILLRIFKEHISCYFSVDFRYSFERWEIKYRYYYIDKGNTWYVIMKSLYKSMLPY